MGLESFVYDNLEVYHDEKPDKDYHLMLMHGYGADAHDLMPLQEYLNLQNINWYFPSGLLDVQVAPGFTGKAWFQIDVASLERAMVSGVHRSFEDKRPEGIDEARNRVLNFLEQTKIPLDKLIIGGFSQGAMLALEVALSLNKSPAGLLLLSGTLLDKATWQEKISARSGLTFFQSHGVNDVILSHKAAQNLEAFLNENGLKGKLMSFQGGHEIPIEVIQEMSKYIKTIFKNT